MRYAARSRLYEAASKHSGNMTMQVSRSVMVPVAAAAVNLQLAASSSTMSTYNASSLSLSLSLSPSLCISLYMYININIFIYIHIYISIMMGVHGGESPRNIVVARVIGFDARPTPLGHPPHELYKYTDVCAYTFVYIYVYTLPV